MLASPPPQDAGGPALAFIATKPIQIIATLILSRQLASTRSSLCVVPTFADGEAVARRLAQRVDTFSSVFTATSRVRALLAHAMRGHDVVFLDSDVGARSTLTMRLVHTLRPRLRFAVYEEGVSLFEPPALERPRRVFELLGATPTMGEGVLTTEVWTYTPEMLRARLPHKRLMRIEQAPAAFAERERDLLASVFWPTYEHDTRGWGGTRCRLYLSSWQIDPRGLAHLKESSDFTVFKPHPHIREARTVGSDVADQVLSATVPAELVVLALARAFEEVTVLHDDSTTARYVTLPNVRFVRLADVPTTSVR
jgi:hypothetical protein